MLAAASDVTLDVRTVLFEPGGPIEAVYFPTDGVISLVTPLNDGSIVEVATIGNEGIVGVPLVPLGTLAVRAITQVAGHGLRVDERCFSNGSSAASRLQTLVDRYTRPVRTIAQTAACNRLHSKRRSVSGGSGEPRSVESDQL